MGGRIAVFGAGAVGGYFGARLAAAGADVHLVARGPHLDAIRAGGLRVRSTGGDVTLRLPATDDPVEIGPCAYVLFCIKSYSTQSAARRLLPLLAEDTAVVSLQNGIDNEEQIAEVVGRHHVMGGTAYIFAHIGEPGLIEHTGGPARLVFGELDGGRSTRAQRLLEWCRAAGIPAEAAKDIRVALWQKLAFLCAQAGMTAAARVPLGEIRSVEETWRMFRRIVEEVSAVATAAGIRLPHDTVTRHMRLAESLEPASLSSLHFDLIQGRRMELEALHGAVVRRAHEYGVPAPMTEAVYALLKPSALRAEIVGRPD